LKRNLIIYHNLGLGDSLLCHGIVRQKAKEYDLVVVLAKYENAQSVAWMYRDLANVLVRHVIDDGDATFFCETIQPVTKDALGNKFPWKRLYLGAHGPGGMKAEIFDQEFYRQADLSFELRWSNFQVQRDEGMENQMISAMTGSTLKLDRDDYVFVHDDASRGFTITKEVGHYCHWHIGKEGWQDVHPWSKGLPIFAYWKVIEQAAEIHCINSSFAIWIDSMDLPKNPKLYLHLYARPSGEVPTFRKDWNKIT
jgi:hypothetical protein